MGYHLVVRKFVKGSETWEISVADNELLIVASRGSDRSFDTRTCKNAAAAEKLAEKMIAARLADGFAALDAKGKKKKTYATAKGKATRWEARQHEQRRVLVLDGTIIVVGPPGDLACYGFDSVAEANDYAKAQLEDWKEAGLSVSKPESISASSVPVSDEPKRPPKRRRRVEVKARAASSGAVVDLEEAIFADPEDLDAWAVYGDWLQEHGDPRGEVVSLEVRAARGKLSSAEAKRCEQLCDEHAEAWLGELLTEALEMEIDGEEVLELEEQFGFIRKAKIRTVMDYSGPHVDELFRELIQLDSFKFIHELRLGVNDLGGKASFDPAMQALAKLGTVKSLRRLVVGDFEMEEQELTWVRGGNCGQLWSGMPNLEYCKIRGSAIELGVLEHAKLETLVIETAGLTKTSVASLGKCKLPRLTELEAWLGVYYRSEDHGEHGSVDDLWPMLEGEGVPQLRHLGLLNCDYVDDIAVALTRAPIVSQLETLDLSMGTMSDVGARALVEHADRFSHLAAINLDENCIDEAEVDALREAFGERVSLRHQEPAEDEEDRYVSVAE